MAWRVVAATSVVCVASFIGACGQSGRAAGEGSRPPFEPAGARAAREGAPNEAALVAQAQKEAPSGEAPVAAAAPTVHFMGRFDMSDPAGPRFAWSGSGIETRFQGTAIDVRLHDVGGNEFQVVVDGQPTIVVKCHPSRDLYTLAQGLSDTTHDIAIYKRTEARVGPVQFLGFAVKGGGPLLPAPARSARRIEFIGDSITAGYGDEGQSATCHYTASTQNAYQTYAAVTSRALGAEHVAVAWSGKTTEGMANLYDRTLPSVPKSRWDFAVWVPDVVVVNLITNDFAMGDPGEATIVGPYVRFVERVRAHYPNALIVCTLGPMLSDTYPAGAHILTRARKYLTAAVASLQRKGDARVQFLEFPAQDFANGLGCDYHPNLKTHRLMADQLTAAIRTQLKW